MLSMCICMSLWERKKREGDREGQREKIEGGRGRERDRTEGGRGGEGELLQPTIVENNFVLSIKRLRLTIQ